MEIKLGVGTIELNLIDVWYKENYWTTPDGTLGTVKTGPFKYYRGHRKAVLWDGAGAVVMELLDFDYPPYSFPGHQKIGRAFHWAKNKLLMYGEHTWLYSKPEEKDASSS
jgi:hypothetical protein